MGFPLLPSAPLYDAIGFGMVVDFWKQIMNNSGGDR
jgi:hypothetical protein